jgi:2'-5' RNA ligase
MKLLAITYPELTEAGLTLIENCRKTHDHFYEVIRPHFTLVFGVSGFSPDKFSSEIKNQLNGINSFSFSIRSAEVHKDDFTEYFHTFLVPGEGFHQLVKLHDKLYSDRLSGHHLRNIEYIPHITIGNSKDKSACEKLADEWNKEKTILRGTISMIDLISFDGITAKTFEQIKLK